MSDYQSRYERVQREINNLTASIHNAILTRRKHPTFGYRKADIWADYHRLEGMLMAWLVLSGWWEHGTMPQFGPAERLAIKNHLGVDLADLHERAENS